MSHEGIDPQSRPATTGAAGFHMDTSGFSRGDLIKYVKRLDGRRGIRKAQAHEFPDAVVWRIPQYDHPFAHYDESDLYTAVDCWYYAIHVHDITGVDGLPAENQLLYYRPSTGRWGGKPGSDGIVCGTVQRSRYVEEITEDGPAVGKLYRVPTAVNADSVISKAMPTQTHPGDRVCIVNPTDSNVTLRLTSQRQGGAPSTITVTPGTYLALKRKTTPGEWATDADSDCGVLCDVRFYTTEIQRAWPRQIRYRGGALIAATGNLQNSRANPTFEKVWRGVRTTNKKVVRLPDPGLERIPSSGYLLETNSAQDGTGTTWRTARGSIGDPAVMMPLEDSRSAVAQIRVHCDHDDEGWPALEVSGRADSRNVLNGPRYVLIRELVAEAIPA